MPWVRLDEHFPDHPKIVQAGPLAAWLHVCALAYCNRYLTDGHIPVAQVPKLADFSGVAAAAVTNGEERGLGTVGSDVDCAQLAEQLVSAGIWRRVKGGFVIHDYLKYQPSKAKVEAEKRQKAEAGRKGGKARSRASPEAEAKQSAKHPLKQKPSKTEAEAQAKSKPDPVPDPLVETKGGENLRAAALNVTPPPRRCPAHLAQSGPVPPCGACADARTAYELWQQQHGNGSNPVDHRLDDQQAVMLTRAQAGQAQAHAIVAEPPDPEAAARIAAIRDNHRLAHNPEPKEPA